MCISSGAASEGESRTRRLLERTDCAGIVKVASCHPLPEGWKAHSLRRSPSACTCRVKGASEVRMTTSTGWLGERPVMVNSSAPGSPRPPSRTTSPSGERFRVSKLAGSSPIKGMRISKSCSLSLPRSATSRVSLTVPSPRKVSPLRAKLQSARYTTTSLPPTIPAVSGLLDRENLAISWSNTPEARKPGRVDCEVIRAFVLRHLLQCLIEATQSVPAWQGQTVRGKAYQIHRGVTPVVAHRADVVYPNAGTGRQIFPYPVSDGDLLLLDLQRISSCGRGPHREA